MMDEMKQDWAKEPWKRVGYGLYDNEGVSIFNPPENIAEEADLDRIVACVNACQGIPTDELEKVTLRMLQLRNNPILCVKVKED